jgi:hypothetical protein
MQTLASLMDFSGQLCFLTSLSSFNFASINISLYKVTTPVSWLSSYSTSLGIIIKHLAYFSFTIHW